MKPLSRGKVLVGAGGLALSGVVFTRPLSGEQRIEQQLQSRMTSFSFGDHLTQGLRQRTTTSHAIAPRPACNP